MGRAAHRPTTMGCFQPGTRRGTLDTTMGSRNTVPAGVCCFRDLASCADNARGPALGAGQSMCAAGPEPALRKAWAAGRAVEDVTDGAIGAAPHLLQPKLLHPRLVRRDGRALPHGGHMLGFGTCVCARPCNA